MEISKIYFDMDGVLADFDRGLRELCGREPLDQSKADKEAEAAMWADVRKVDHFYYKLKPIPGALEMVKWAIEKYGKDCEILSAIPKPHRNIVGADPDKRRWIKEYVSEEMEVNICERKEDKKNKALGKSYVLIDDYDANIQAWEEAGGTGILFKSPEDVMRILKGEE